MKERIGNFNYSQQRSIEVIYLSFRSDHQLQHLYKQVLQPFDLLIIIREGNQPICLKVVLKVDIPIQYVLSLVRTIQLSSLLEMRVVSNMVRLPLVRCADRSNRAQFTTSAAYSGHHDRQGASTSAGSYQCQTCFYVLSSHQYHERLKNIVIGMLQIIHIHFYNHEQNFTL